MGIMLLTPNRSDMIHSRIQKTVEAALKEKKISARRASLDVVGNDGLIRDIRAGRLPGVDRLDALFEYLGLEFYFGPPRVQRLYEQNAPQEVSALKAPKGYFTIPWHPQQPLPKDGSTMPIAFSKEWLSQLKLDPAHLCVVRPTQPGDETVALVDPAAVQSGGPNPWCYREGTDVRMDNIQFEPDFAIMLPKMPNEKARVFQGQSSNNVTFLGRVIWFGQIAS